MAESLELRIIELLSNNPDKLFSIADIAKQLKVAYSHAHMFVSRLIAQQIISKQHVGKTIVCRLNIKQPLTLAKLSEISYKKTFEWSKKDPRAEKIFAKIEQVKENVHSVMLQNNKIIVVIPESAKNADFSIFPNRSVLTPYELRKNKNFYTNILILHGAEKYWSLIQDA
ncbi:MAG: hypothetical protein KJ574_04605 [Nanoarchaeota archaeon]|nr:hypothetical protein [Nanoarchaeota archaeon]